MRKIKQRTFIALFSFLLLIIALVPMLFSWLIKEKDVSITITIDKYTIEIVVFFNELKVTSDSPYYDSVKKQLIIDASDPDAPNYVGNLNISLKTTPHIASRLRVKLMDEWRIRRHYIESIGINDIFQNVYIRADENGQLINPFMVASDLDYQIDQDGYMYYMPIINKGEELDVEWIVGGIPYPVHITETFEEECTLYLDILVEIVQANRFSEVWGISEDFYSTSTES